MPPWNFLGVRHQLFFLVQLRVAPAAVHDHIRVAGVLHAIGRHGLDDLASAVFLTIRFYGPCRIAKIAPID